MLSGSRITESEYRYIAADVRLIREKNCLDDDDDDDEDLDEDEDEDDDDDELFCSLARSCFGR